MDNRSIQWRIYYADETTVDSTQSTWAAAPSRGLLAIVSPSSVTGRRMSHGRNFYACLQGEPYGMDWPGCWDWLIEQQHSEAHKPLRDVDLDALAGPIKLGRYASRATFAAVLRLATDDPDFPPRSARDRDDESTGEA